MPRNVRNAWIDVTIDGRKSHLMGGPKSKTGGLHADISVRDQGSVVRAATVDIRADAEGRIMLRIFDRKGDIIHKSLTLRNEP